MAEPEWMETARKKGLKITGYGVREDALPGSTPVPDRALGQLAVAAFAAMCQAARNEKQFQEVVTRLATHLGWKWTHVRPARVMRHGKEIYETPIDGDAKGMFDCEFVRERLFKAELKYGKNTLSDEQLDWWERYKNAGVECYVWYPRDFDEIMEVLTRRVR